MLRKTVLLSLVVLVGLAGGCAKQEQAADPAEVAYDVLREAWDEAETTEAKVALAENYLAQFPDTAQSGRMASAIAYYRGYEMEDPEGAWSVLSAALEKIEDPEQRFEVGMEALGLADSIEIPLDVATLAEELGAQRALTYSEYQQVVNTAIDLEEWEVANDHATTALELATPEAFRANYPDREFTDEEVAEKVAARKADALASNGWALFNLGETEAAMARFEEADEVGGVSYLGLPNSELYSYWGRAALSAGDYDKAIELLGAETAFGNNGSGSETYLREAYTAKNGDEEGFDEFMWSTRSQLAKTADDFELLDYEGNAVRLSEVGKGNVTLLAFWFPT